jgi:AcrR family transcriptional regulator
MENKMPTKRIPLKRAEILTKALRIIDTEGVDALSMRRLAGELGVEAMSLYHHFENKDAILSGVIDLALEAEAPAPPSTPPSSWREPVTAAILGFRRVLVKHPNVLPVMATHPPTTGSSAVYIQGPLAYLRAQGFSETDATDLFQAVFALSFGHAMLAQNYGTIDIPGTPAFSFTEDAFTRVLDVLLHGYDGSVSKR